MVDVVVVVVIMVVVVFIYKIYLTFGIMFAFLAVLCALESIVFVYLSTFLLFFLKSRVNLNN
mgnify:CR=1 FL=1